MGWSLLCVFKTQSERTKTLCPLLKEEMGGGYGGRNHCECWRWGEEWPNRRGRVGGGRLGIFVSSFQGQTLPALVSDCKVTLDRGEWRLVNIN